ncbi:glucosaminidase [Ferrimonas sediminicola]|uniref:Glucosaminidase n=1 Tax=Ferrimonas sediminicola TaxID=2569538 RepID=A0A4U1BK87_9GAMM|nr:glucosaminidase domain-containing protein [Ferrimonas sediminicola]TKB50510.1 glucosaminidase [Ferrimonas sediminicola]
MRPLAGVIVALGLVALGILWIETQVDEKRPEVARLPIQPNTAVSALPDFAAIADVREKKRAFFGFLRPTVEQVNLKINGQRQFLLQLKQRLDQGLTISGPQAAKAERIAQQYGYELRQISSETLAPLLVRVDTIPVEMVLVQAANETGWGSSRFARDGLNFFGQWCFKAGCGLVPQGRDDGRNHEVAKFDTVEASVSSYLKNLNTNPAYQDLRAIRSELRGARMEVTAASLIPGLIRYSERKEAYVDELLNMLETNRRYM